MKYILLMSSTNAGVSGYHTWSPSDRDTHMEALRTLVKELVETSEFVAAQGLAEPKEAKVVRGEKDGLPVTDSILPESKEFLLGYWIVDVALRTALTPLRAGVRRRRDREEFRPTCRSKCGSSQMPGPNSPADMDISNASTDSINGVAESAAVESETRSRRS